MYSDFSQSPNFKVDIMCRTHVNYPRLLSKAYRRHIEGSQKHGEGVLAATCCLVRFNHNPPPGCEQWHKRRKKLKSESDVLGTCISGRLRLRQSRQPRSDRKRRPPSCLSFDDESRNAPCLCHVNQKRDFTDSSRSTKAVRFYQEANRLLICAGLDS